MMNRSFILLALSLSITASRPLPPLPAACTMPPAPVRALLRVEQDTTLPHAAVRQEAGSWSSVRPGTPDSIFAVEGTPMPAARVRLLDLDSVTRAALVAQGVRAEHAVAYLRAAPYTADCRTIVYRAAEPFAVKGEVGYVRAILAPPEQWLNGAPVLVINATFSYPYPRRRGLLFRVPAETPLASAADLFSYEAALDMPRARSAEESVAQQDAMRDRAVVWARANAKAAELLPIRTLIRRVVLEPDWRVVVKMQSRLRGTYRVDFTAGDEHATWFFRTHDRPGYIVRFDTLTTTAQLLAQPHVEGYSLVGRPAAALASLPVTYDLRSRQPLAWLRTDDRPSVPGNEARRVLRGELEFMLSAIPERFWDDIETFVPPMNPVDSAMLVRINPNRTRGDRQAKLPMSVRLDADGGVRADTSFVVRGRVVRVLVERVDTASLARPVFR